MKKLLISLALSLIITNAYSQWTPVLSVPGQTMISASFVNSSTGYVLAKTNVSPQKIVLYKTSNNGVSWNLVSTILGTSMWEFLNYGKISFSNENNGIFIGRYSNLFYKTSNGGITWTENTFTGSGISNYSYLNAIEKGIIFGWENSQNYISTDNGNSFTTITGFNGNFDLEMIDKFTGYKLVVTDYTNYPNWQYNLSITTNTGISWTSVSGFNSSPIFKSSFVDKMNGYFITDYEMKSTNNGGLTINTTTAIGGYFNDFISASKDHVILSVYDLNSNYKVIESFDGGYTFQTTDFPNDILITFDGENFFNDKVGYVISYPQNGNPNSLYRYDNGGFIAPPPPPQNTISGLSNYQLIPQNNLSSCVNSDLSIALSVSSATSGIIGLDFEIPYDGSKFYIKSVIAGNNLISTNSIDINTVPGSPNKLMIGVSSSSLSGAGSILLNNDGVILNITLGATSVLSNGVYSFERANVIESYLTSSTGFTFTGVNNIVVSLNGSNLLSGNVYYRNTNKSLTNNGNSKITVDESQNCVSLGNPILLSGMNSSFSFTPNVNVNSIKLHRNIVTSSGVSTFINSTDAIAVTQIRQVVSPYQNPTLDQLLAADINSDGLVTSGDRTQILRRSVLNLSAFSEIPNAKDWKFYKIGTTFTFSKDNVPNLSNCINFTSSGLTCLSFETLSIIGILTGDVNGNYSTTANGSNFKQESNGTLTFDLSGKVANVTQIVPVYYVGNELGIDFTLDFIQSNGVSIKNITLNNSVLNESDFNIYKNDKLNFSGILNSIPDSNTPIIWIEFNTSKNLTDLDFSLLNTFGLSNDSYLTTNFRKESTTGFDSNSNDVNFNLYPNPNEGSFSIISNKISVEYSIYSVYGVKMYSNYIRDYKTNLDLGLSQGVYFIFIQGKVIKMVIK